MSVFRLSLFWLMLLAPLVTVQAQDIEILWDSLYAGPTEERLHDLILLPDGRLAGAGEMRRQDKSTDGLFVLIDPQNGEIQKKAIGGFGDQVFNSVAEADDGSFYLVGFTKLKKKKYGFVVRLNDAGEEIGRKDFQKQGEGKLEKIAWMDNGAGIAIGQLKKNSEGYLWTLSIDGDNYRNKDAVGRGFVGSLEGMEKDLSGRLWLTGNPLKKSKVKSPWLFQLDENALTREGFFINENRSEEQVANLALTPEGEVLLAGKTWKGIDGASDAWVAEYDTELQFVNERSFSFEGDDGSEAIYKSPSKKRWMVQKNAFGGSTLIGWEAESLEKELLTLDDNTGFKVVKLFKTYFGTYIVAGISKDPEKNRRGIRVICFKNGDQLASKSMVTLVLENPEFKDANQDGFLSPNERASLHFTVRNDSEVPLKEGRISVADESVVEGLTVLHRTQYLPYLPAGGSVKRYIGLKGEGNLRAGISAFNIALEAEKRSVQDILFEVESIEAKKADGGQKARMHFQQPKLSGGERKVAVSENLQRIQLTIASSRRLKAEDVKIISNGTVQEDKKAEAKIFDRGIEKGAFVYEFSTVVALKDSINVVYVSLDDFKTDSIVFEWRNHYPDLHVLAIGPAYGDLKYTAKDAGDFARAFAKQAGLGFFDQVFVDTLVTPMRTTKSNIEIAFKGLWVRDTSETRSDRIKPNDYLVVFYSGHGVKKGKSFYLVPSDYNPDGGTDAMLNYQHLLTKYINKIECKKFLFVDACHSGSAKSGPVDMTMAQALMEANSMVPGLTSIASCSANELSYEDKEWQNGAFTEAILEALDGGRGNLPMSEKESVTPINIRQFFNYVQPRVRELVNQKSDGAIQTPVLTVEPIRETLTLFAVPKQ